MTEEPKAVNLAPGRPERPAEATRLNRARHIFYLVWAVIGIIVLFVAAGYALGQVSSALAIIVTAALVVFILKAPVDFLHRRGVPRWLGALIAYLIGLAVLVVLGLIIIPIVTQQLVGLIALVPGYVDQATHFFSDIYQQYSYLLEDSNVQQIITSAGTNITQWAVGFASSAPSTAITIGTSAITAVVIFVVALIVGYWILKDLPTIGREFRIIAGPRFSHDLSFIASACSRALGGYLKGMVVAGACTGTMAGIGFAIIGLPYPVLLALLTALMNFIPYIGPWITGTIVAILGLFISPLVAILAIIITIVAQQLTDNLITPRVMSATVKLHPSVVLVGVFAGGALAGLPGLIGAVPLLAAIKSIFVHYFEERTGRDLASSDGALFQGRTYQMVGSLREPQNKKGKTGEKLKEQHKIVIPTPAAKRGGRGQAAADDQPDRPEKPDSPDNPGNPDSPGNPGNPGNPNEKNEDTDK